MPKRVPKPLPKFIYFLTSQDPNGWRKRQAFIPLVDGGYPNALRSLLDRCDAANRRLDADGREESYRYTYTVTKYTCEVDPDQGLLFQ